MLRDYEATILAIISARGDGRPRNIRSAIKELGILETVNVSRTLANLLRAGYVCREADFRGNRLPKNYYSVSASGKAALESYASHLENLANFIRSSMGMRNQLEETSTGRVIRIRPQERSLRQTALA